jgi:hypothetical protein
MPKDLEGKKVGAPARDAAFAQWPIFVQTTGIDARKVTIVDVGFAAREPILADGQVDYDHAIFLGHLCLPSRMADKPAQGLFDKFRDFPSAFREQATALRANAQKWSSWPKQSGLNQNSFYIELDSAIRDLRKIADAFEHLEKQN